MKFWAFPGRMDSVLVVRIAISSTITLATVIIRMFVRLKVRPNKSIVL